jgi:transcriptional regulator of met regulon
MAAKNNKLAWIIVIIAVVIIAVIAIVATILFGNNPEKTIDETFTALKKGNMDVLMEYTSTEGTDNSFTNELTEGLTNGTDSTENTELEKEMLDSCFSQLEWKIAETKKDGDTAVVTVDITNKDFSNVMQEIFSEMMAQAFASAFTGQEMTEEDTMQLMKEKIDEVTATTTNTEEINMVKEDGIWKFSNSDELANMLLPGFASGLESMQDSINDSFGLDSEYNDAGL